MLIAEPDVLLEFQRKKLPGFLLASVRGVGQVDLQPCLWTGMLILAGLWAAGWEIGLFATLGTLVSTAAAHLVAVDRSNIALGLQGYCGCLTGVALVTSLGGHPATYALAVIGAVMCTMLLAALTTLLAPYGLTALTAPFCLVSGIMVIGAPSFGRIWHGAPRAVSSTTTGDRALSWHDLWHAFFTNISQVFLVDEWYVGLIMLVGLAFAGARVVLYAAAGSVVGIFAAWALGAPASLISNGIYGYNAVLVAIAMGAVFLTATVWNGVYALIGAAATTGLTAALTSIFKTFGGHTFTWPFILTTWAFMAAVPALPRFRRSG
ncbi:urea transporter [Streptomyces sp. NBC_01477]|uniref:urea transporter n=1 Tax=Streptomyces sp. NBC_01477 TaxID=2976015 RepID=UPI002E33AE64|nr:urea transporter [Streptomyces sp. NBC_01477]